jgi:hypothetical protein
VGSYALAFTYEAGFGSLYNIPPSVISLSLTTAFVAAAAGASALILSYQVLAVLAGFVPRPFIPSSESEKLRLGQFLSLIFLPTAYGTLTGLNPVIIIGGFALCMVVYAKQPAGYASPPTAVTALFKKLNPKFLLMLNLAAYLLLIAFMLGRYRALLEPKLVFDQGETHYVVLRIYGEDIIAAPYVEELTNPNNLIVVSRLRFLKVGDKETPEFRTRDRRTQLSIHRERLLGVDSWLDWAYPYE